MAEFLGIRNENEFYFAHYLSSLMDDELKEQCQNEVLGAARDKLLKLANDYYEVRHLRERVEQRKGTFAADAKEYLETRKGFVEKLISILGYSGDYRPNGIVFQGEKVGLPVLGCVLNAARVPQVVLIDSCRTFSAGVNLKEASLLQNFPTPTQIDCEGLTPADREFLSTRVRGDKAKSQMPYWENLITNELFASANHPRFAIVFGENAVLLADYTKWAERRSLVFLLDDIFEQTDRATCRAMACLLHRNSLAPDSGSEPLPDKLDANSHKNAFGVSKSLRYAMRQAIEDLGNAILRGMGNGERGTGNGERGTGREEVSAAELSKECILVMYRFLFVLFLESRKDLQYFKRSEGNAANDIFWSAYGLDHLRDLETVPLLTEAAKNGHYFDESIKQLFVKMWEGANVDDTVTNPAASVEGFRLLPLKAHLFDPERTPLFNEAQIPNHVWQKIIYSLSIGETGTGKRKRKGRISYAQLGIQQLGAVYEALLSYTGFYAKEDLYEVAAAAPGNGESGTGNGEEADDSDEAESPAEKKASGKSGDIFETGYFVTEAELKDYTEAEIVAVDGRRVCHKKGSFIYRMAGRDRERSASYYTPNELTRCLVRQAIAERVKPDMKAKDIMKLTVCEPAMGSAAFLNEMVDQLAEIYLARAEKERGETIPLEQRAAKKARVKMVIADQNVFGVDLNPMAADLAEVSLWLGTIGGEMEPTGQDRDSVYIPWFGNQLVCGNSIIGARREVVLADGSHQRVGFAGDSLPRGGVWHFLLPDDGMALNLDKVVKGLCPEEDKKIKAWKKSFRLFDKNKKAERERYEKQRQKLLDLTKAVNELWLECAKEAKEVDEQTFDDVDYYGHKSSQTAYTNISTKDILLDQIEWAAKLENASTTFRMKMLLDMWCALWFWPLDKVDELPSYEDYLCAAELLAKKDFSADGQMLLDFMSDVKLTTQKDVLVKAFRKEPTFENLYNLFPFTKTAREIAARQRFLHWELTFVNVFYQRGGFDFVIGNPPWVKLQWEEAGILSEYDPHIAVRKISASDTMALRAKVLGLSGGAPLTAYLQEFADTTGSKSFLNSPANNPELAGVQTNLYKFFIPLAFRINNEEGVTGYLHPEGVYDDPNGGKLRAIMYPRLRLHARFVNELRLFDILHLVEYSINIYGPRKTLVHFKSVARLFHPSTLDASLSTHAAENELPLERTTGGSWNLIGHPDRIVEVSEDTLSMFARLYGGEGCPSREARIPALYTKRFLHPILNRFACVGKKMADISYGVSECWHETNAQKEGFIIRNTGFRNKADKVIYSGPLIFISTPICKTARPNCRLLSDYDNVDLTVAKLDYRPRTNYVYNESSEYSKQIPVWHLKPVSEYWRIFCRRMISGAMFRTHLPCLAPKGYLHIGALIEFVFESSKEASNIIGTWSSLPYDWFIRGLGKSDFRNDTASLLPVLPDNPMIRSRALLLNCLNRDYADLWREAWNDAYLLDGWLSSDPRLTKWADHLVAGSEWKWETPLRTQLDRRQALVELDVIVTKALGLSLDDLLLMYRVSFPTMRKYDADTWYDQNGRCVFSAKSGESYLSRKEWEAICDMKEGEFSKTITETVFSDTPTDRTIIYKAPFFRKCREDDYKEAWEMMAKREGKEANRV